MENKTWHFRKTNKYISNFANHDDHRILLSGFPLIFNLLGNDSINHKDRNFLQMSITLKVSVVWEQKKRTKRNFVE